MIYNTYGKTGIEVSAIGLGGMRFPDQEDWDKGAAVIKAAYDAGINYFDTAPGYGKSEDICGVAFKEMKATREQRPFYVSTKTFGATPDDVRRDLETSLRRMGLDYIDFYHMWCILTPEAFEQRKAVLPVFEKLKEEGLIRHIVVSSHMAGHDVGDLLRAYPFEGVLLGYSAMNFAYREAGVQAAADLGRAVVAMNPLGGGIIPEHPARFEFLRTRPECSVTESALHFLLNDPRITISLVGAGTEAHLAEAVRAVDSFRPLDAETLGRMRGGLKEAFDELCTACRYCDHCPEGIPVPKYMDAYNQYMLSGKVDALISRLRYHWGLKPEDDYLQRCTECGACEAACTQKLPIIARLKEIRAELESARVKQSGA